MTAGEVTAPAPAPDTANLLYRPAPRRFTGVYAKSTKYDSTGRVLLTDNGMSVYGTSYFYTRKFLLLLLVLLLLLSLLLVAFVAAAPGCYCECEGVVAFFCFISFFLLRRLRFDSL